MSPLHFYFDFISPYGYFASLRIEELAARHGRTVEWHSILLGVSVMKVMGLKPLLDTPLKGDYVRRDVERYRRQHGLATKRTADHPIMNPLTCGRAFQWVKANQPQLAVPVAQALLHAHWGEGLDLSEPDSLREVRLPAGIGADWLVEGAQSPEAARLLRSEVDASIAAGIFGSPTVVVDGEMFWGVDKLDTVELWLQRGGW